ncbi:5'-nucleotidase C-terminal domain-containing protein [Myxococcota bacterium]|nr:5'-nucleotidase C-terminal domain-containing protein [Myxococcota bacterium]MBU1432627.1 5'-nucleotidase C-terminal domain-containing protein [Myxococcota bacterium]MBU1899510.1 5'-nucleotidase C-terminal domain-containing protein [Myxococcota bacterium]
MRSKLLHFSATFRLLLAALIFTQGPLNPASAAPPIPVNEVVKGAEDVEAIVAIYKRQLGARLSAPLATATTDLSSEGAPSSPLGLIVAEGVLRQAQRLAPKTQIFMTNDGGLRVSLSQGTITLAHVYELMPFDNEVVLLTVSGAVLADICDAIALKRGEPVAGLSATLDPQAGRATDVRIGGAPLDPQGVYHLATSDYLVEAGWMRDAVKGIAVERTGLLLRDAIAAAFKAHVGPLTPPATQPFKWSAP